MVINLYTCSEFFDNAYVVEIFGAFIFSIMAFLTIWFLRPSVKISPHIAKIEKDGKSIYKIKIINASCIFQLVDVHFEFTMLKPISSPRGTNIAIKEVELVSNHLWFLSRRKTKISNIFSKDLHATYAIVITVKGDFDLREQWLNGSNDSTFFDLKVIAKNNFSGITSITHEKFNHHSCIKNGVYCHGNSFDIEPNYQ